MNWLMSKKMNLKGLVGYYTLLGYGDASSVIRTNCIARNPSTHITISLSSWYIYKKKRSFFSDFVFAREGNNPEAISGH
jgi:hypothetical protein